VLHKITGDNTVMKCKQVTKAYYISPSNNINSTMSNTANQNISIC